MLKINNYVLNILLGLCTLLICTTVSASQTYVVIASPPPKEVIVVPPGAVHCNYIRAGVHHGKYTEAYRVCYARQGHVQWVSGHWECPKYNSWKGTCRKWVWVPSFWIRR